MAIRERAREASSVSTLSTVDRSVSPARVTFPAPYNAASDLVDRQLEAGHGDRVAFQDDTRTLTYATLAEQVQRAGNALLALGLQPEQRVLLVMLDTVDFPVVFLGAIRAGLVPVPVNTLLTEADYRYLATDSRARAVIVSDALLAKVSPAITDVPHVIVAPSVLGGPAHDRASLPELLAAAAPVLEPARTHADEPAFWLYSSGSTGAPKGCVHLHASIAWTTVLYAQDVLGLRQDDKVYSAAKLFFAYGLGNALTFPLSVGASAVLSAERPTPASVARMHATHEPTVFGGVPTLFAALLAGGHAASPRLRVSTSAGEALPAHVGRTWRERHGSPILDGIGSTEMLHVFVSNRVDHVEDGTTGTPVPGYDVKLVGDDGGPVADGEEGSLWVHGPSCATHYWNQREKSLATFYGPWTRTGDRYVRRADGAFVYSGRADDMLKVGGIWVSPFEVESALAAHPAVLECAVVGHADEHGLIKPRAFVVCHEVAPPELAHELRAHVKALLAPYKYPRWIDFVTELPKTATGKIQRYKLREP